MSYGRPLFSLNILHNGHYFGRIDESMEGLKVKLETAYKASGGRKVNIISHSMGGLLLSCFMSLHGDVSGLSLCYLLKFDKIS